jgi:hypothetical protein
MTRENYAYQVTPEIAAMTPAQRDLDLLLKTLDSLAVGLELPAGKGGYSRKEAAATARQAAYAVRASQARA